MKFKVGDRVRVLDDPSGEWRVVEEERNTYGVMHYWAGDDWHEEDDLELVTDPLVDKIEERNNKTVKIISGENLLNDNDPIKPAHYRKGEIDLYESWYRTHPFNEFRAIMSAIAERYMKRDKDNRIQDLDKAIYTLSRLKEYEEMEK